MVSSDDGSFLTWLPDLAAASGLQTPVSRYFADARVLSIFEGAEETLAIRVIGRELVERARRKGVN